MIKVENLTIKYKSGITALENFSFEFKLGKITVILGPSGSGKSTLLLAITGLLDDEISSWSGKIFLNGKDITLIPSEKRNVPLVFQNLALFPHMTVYDNIAFPLKIRKLKKNIIKEKTKSIIEMLGLSDFVNFYPDQLSGGQKQKVALGRALVLEPEIILLDEPLGSIDKKFSDQLQSEIRELQKKLNMTMIYVTHNQEEALNLADEILILKEGKLIQSGTPHEIYLNPLNSFVADFFGNANFLKINSKTPRINETLFETDIGIKLETTPENIKNKNVNLAMIRPENIFLSDQTYTTPNNVNTTEVLIQDIIFLGDRIKIIAKHQSGYRFFIKKSINEFNPEKLKPGEKIKIKWKAQDVKVF